MPKFYFDVAQVQSFAEKGQPPFTPAVSLYYGLDVALEMMDKEGMEGINNRHHDIADYTRGKVKALGLQLLAEGPQASDTVTSVRVPDGVTAASSSPSSTASTTPSSPPDRASSLAASSASATWASWRSRPLMPRSPQLRAPWTDSATRSRPA